jgi:tetratricopeptide (TPR) repeat protein
VSLDGSVAKIGKALQLNSKEGRYFTRLGQEYLVLTNEEMLKGEKDRDVNKIQAYLSVGVQAGAKGKDLMKNDVTSVETLAQIYENSGLYIIEGLNLAEKEYQRALELEPNNPSYYVRMGQIRTRMAGTKDKAEDKKKLVEEARDFYQKSLDVRNSFDAGYYNLAIAQEALGQTDDAIGNMNKAVSLQRKNVNYVFNLARMYQARGKGDDNKTAEALFKQILGVNDKEINSHFNLGLLYEKTDRKSEAIDEYNKVIQLLPQGSETTKSQLEKMISNIKIGVENTPENLGLTTNPAEESSTGGTQEQSEPLAPETTPQP